MPDIERLYTMALPSKNRLAKKKDIEYVFKNGRRLTTTSFRLFFCPNDLPYSRFAFSISKKVSKKAVMRNRLRRRVASWILGEKRLKMLKRDYMLVFLPPSAKETKTFFYEELKRAFSGTY